MIFLGLFIGAIIGFAGASLLSAAGRADEMIERASSEGLEREVEQLRVQLAGCGVAALGWAQRDAIQRGDYGWSQSYQDVVNLRRKYEEFLRAKTLDKEGKE